MPNTFLTPTWVLKDVGLGYEVSTKFITNVKRYSNQYEFGGAKVGNTVQYRLPQQWLVSDGQALQEQPILDQTVPITLTNQKHIDFAWSSAQATTEVEEVRRRYTQPAGKTLAAIADAFAFQTVYRDVWNTVGTPGTTPNATLTYLQAGVKLADGGAPDDGLIGVLDPMAMATIANTSSTLFNPPSTIAGNYRKGQFGGMQLGFDEWYRDTNRPTHTTGTFTASTPIIASAGQTGSTISTTGWASGASTLRKGDRINIAGVFSVNPVSKVSTGRLQDFVVTADTSDVTGAMATLPISPSIITSGALQTVNASPANNAAITVWSANPAGGVLAVTASPQSMMFHPEAFAFVTADLENAIGGESSRLSSTPGGFSLRLWRDGDIRTDQQITRIDMLIGAATLQARLAVRVVG